MGWPKISVVVMRCFAGMESAVFEGLEGGTHKVKNEFWSLILVVNCLLRMRFLISCFDVFLLHTNTALVPSYIKFFYELSEKMKATRAKFLT